MLNSAVTDGMKDGDEKSTASIPVEESSDNNKLKSDNNKSMNDFCTSSLRLDDINVIDDGAGDLQEPLISNDINNTDSNKKRFGCTSFIQRVVLYSLDIFTDQSGSIWNIIQGMSLMMFMGAILGLAMPKNDHLPTPSYRTVSSVVGYTYFVCWSVSLYPQIITNYQRKSTVGLSVDAQLMAFLNYACYAIYNVEFFFNPGIQDEYQQQHHASETVQSNDVAFSLHALLMTFITLLQIAYYNRDNGALTSSISIVTISLIGGVSIICGLYIVGILCHRPGFLWIDFLYILAFIKLAFTICFYIPQLLLNMKRRSTQGFNIWSILLDFSGGLLSLLQIVGDSIDMNSLKTGVVGNWAKFLLGFVTLFFDSCFFLQHYVLYRNNSSHDNTTPETKSMALLFKEFYDNQELV